MPVPLAMEIGTRNDEKRDFRAVVDSSTDSGNDENYHQEGEEVQAVEVHTISIP